MAPQRQRKRRVQSDKAQGKGSWVDFKPMTYGERLALREEQEAHKDDETTDWTVEQEKRLFVDHIIEWNWVDDNDQPLPVPSQDITVLEGLTDVEYEFLTSLFDASANGKK